MVEINRTQIPVRKLASGETLTIEKVELKGVNSGPNVYIQANLHGAEVQGNIVIYQLYEALKNEKLNGKITLVPRANPYGLNQKMGEYTFGRFEPVTGENYNRCYWNLNFEKNLFDELATIHDPITRIDLFQQRIKDQLESIKARAEKLGCSYEKKLCLTLQSMAMENDYVLDLHTASHAVEHLYSPEYSLDSANFLGIQNIIITQKQFAGALDEACFVPWLCFYDELMKRGVQTEIPREAFTVECGSQEKALEGDANLITEKILNFLRSKQVIPGQPKKYDSLKISSVENYRGIYAPRGGIFSFSVKPGERVDEGSVLGSFYDGLVKEDFKTPYSGTIINAFDSSVVHEGAELFRILL